MKLAEQALKGENLALPRVIKLVENESSSIKNYRTRINL